MNMVRNLKLKLVLKSLHILYFSYIIRPMILYDDSIYDNCAPYGKDVETTKTSFNKTKILN